MTASISLKDALLAPRALTPRQRDRRERIQAATFSLLARHGGEALSMKMIAQAAGVAERTLFNIYGSKDGLFASSARERSEETIAEAHRDAAGGGMAFFRMLPRKLAGKTFAAPALARAFAPILVAHAGLVGLPEVYETYAGSALRDMRTAGLLVADDIALLSRLVCISMVGTIILWAKREIADDALETHLRLAICQVLLPHVEPPLAGELREEARSHTRALSRVAVPA
ncbi:MAG TPA: TetR/AcrR family transcriptional regulator [Novosphingobium sp.]|nr:TetR/AcrR family transcriptional regulator [Novosphingobium sp.]